MWGTLFMKQNLTYECHVVFITTYLSCRHLVSSMARTAQHNAIVVVDYNSTQYGDWLSYLTLAKGQIKLKAD